MVTPKNKQTIIDLCLQYTGSIESLFTVCKSNGYDTITPNMSAGVLIDYNEKSRVAQFYRQNGIYPSTLPIQEPPAFSEFTNEFNFEFN